MIIGITGGTGTIGSALTNHAINAGHDVVIYTRIGNKQTTGKNIEYRLWNPMEAQMEPVDDLDILVNLAGATLAKFPWSEKRKQIIRSSRVDAGRTIIDTLSRSKKLPQVLFQASAIGGYGTSGDTEFTDLAPLGNDYLSSVCKDWEVSTEAVERMGVRRIVGRIGLVLHPKSGFLPKLEATTHWMIGGRLGTGRQWYSWILIDDLVRAIFHVIEIPDFAGVVNLTAPIPLRMDDFGRTLAKVLRKPYWLPVPAIPLRLLLGEMSTLVLDGQKVVPYRLIESGFKFQFDKLEPALQLLYK